MMVDTQRILALAALIAISSAFERSPSVLTTTGPVRGHLVKVPSRVDITRVLYDVYEFSGIPFAEPPVGENRFRKTVSKKPWKEELDAIHLPNECSQFPPSNAKQQFMQQVNMSEDCLYLNIWVPKAALDQKMSLPVYFWIHGGSFMEGASTYTKQNGTTMAAYQNIIIVSIQYRLGPLGFAYLGVDDVPGNMGMWDQLEALKWISSNIAAFGGDSRRITVGGNSAGGASASLLLVSPHSRSYISKAIIQSGSILGSWGSMTASEGIHRTNKLFKWLALVDKDNCDNVTAQSDIKARVNCLMKVDSSLFSTRLQLLLLDVDYSVWTGGVIDNLPLQPVVDGNFIPRDPVQMIAEGDFSKVPMLSGINKDEGTFNLLNAPIGIKLLPNEDEPDRPMDYFDYAIYQEMVDSYFCYYPTNGQKIKPEVKKQIEMQYWRYPENDMWWSQKPLAGVDVFNQISTMVGDASIGCPMIALADAFSAFNSVYQYFFTHRLVYNPDLEWFGVAHADELQFTMGDALNQNQPRANYTDEERLLCQRIIQYWGNFITYGDPNNQDDAPINGEQLRIPKWPRYQQYSGDTLELNKDGSVGNTINSLKRRDCQFWNSYLPRLDSKLAGEVYRGYTTTPCPKIMPRGSTGAIFQLSPIVQSLVMIVAVAFLVL